MANYERYFETTITTERATEIFTDLNTNHPQLKELRELLYWLIVDGKGQDITAHFSLREKTVLTGLNYMDFYAFKLAKHEVIHITH